MQGGELHDLLDLGGCELLGARHLVAQLVHRLDLAARPGQRLVGQAIGLLRILDDRQPVGARFRQLGVGALELSGCMGQRFLGHLAHVGVVRADESPACIDVGLCRSDLLASRIARGLQVLEPLQDGVDQRPCIGDLLLGCVEVLFGAQEILYIHAVALGGALPESVRTSGGGLGFAAIAANIAPGALGELVYQVEHPSTLGDVGSELLAGLLHPRQSVLVRAPQLGHAPAAGHPFGQRRRSLLE